MTIHFFRKAITRAGLSVVGALMVCVFQATAVFAQNSPELSSLDMWIVQRYRGAQLLPDSGARSTATLVQAGAPRVESTRTTARRDIVVALHFGSAMWRSTLNTSAAVQLADPTGAISGIAAKITARRAFRTPRKAGARDTVKDDWRIGWAYLVAIPARAANASPSGFAGWAIAETSVKNAAKATATPLTPLAKLPPNR
ncbi:MAG: hypothetical protein ABI852_11635 [Gemmatimonadaceae bacterium]